MIARQQDGAIKPSANGHNIYFKYIYHGHNIVGQQLTQGRIQDFFRRGCTRLLGQQLLGNISFVP